MDLAVRRSARHKTTKAVFTPVKPRGKTLSMKTGANVRKADKVHNVDYELNRTKAIKNKILASNREFTVVVKFSRGNIVLTFSAAAYQEFKAVTINFLRSQPVTVNITETTENKGAVVSESVSILNDNSKLFVLNFYNSTSRILLNGNQTHIITFINEYLTHILNILDNNEKFITVNEQIREYCIQYLSRNEQNEKPDIALAIEKVALDTSKTDNTSDFQHPLFPICPICDKDCDDKPTSVACDICNTWLHYKCEKLTRKEIEQVKKPENQYICRACNEQCNTNTINNESMANKTLHGSDDQQLRVNRPDVSNNTANIVAIANHHERSSTRLHNVPSLRMEKNSTPAIHRSSLSAPNTNTVNYTGASHSTSTESVQTPPNLPRCGIDQNLNITNYMPSPSALNANMNNDNGKQSLRNSELWNAESNNEKQSLRNSELLNAESNHLKSVIKEKDKLLKSKENSILKYIAEIDQLKKQLATNRSYTITIEQKHKDLQHSLKVATERIEQIEHTTHVRGSNNINPTTQQKQSAPQSEINEMKVWVLEQKFRQLELDLHKNNIELMMIKNQQNSDNLNEGTTKSRNRKRRKPHFRGGNTNEPKPAQINIAQQMDDYLMYEQRTDESTPVESVIQHDESFLEHASPTKVRLKETISHARPKHLHNTRRISNSNHNQRPQTYNKHRQEANLNNSSNTIQHLKTIKTLKIPPQTNTPHNQSTITTYL